MNKLVTSTWRSRTTKVLLLLFLGAFVGVVLVKFKEANFSPTQLWQMVKLRLGYPMPPREVALSTPASPLRRDFAGVLSPAHPEWKVRRGLDVELVATGFSYPVNIAFVAGENSDPTSPWFYVSELHGKIKYVARDGSVHLYADELANIVPQDMFFSDESGIIGLAIVPDSEDLIITFSYQDPQLGLLSSKIVRLVSKPGGKQLKRAEVLLDLEEPTARSHQIQSALVGPDGKLYVGVGDGEDPRRAMDLEKFGGKMLRMNLDGTPCTDNPFYQRNQRTMPSHYVFAYGFRNPFGFDFDPNGGRLYVSDNGPTLDRLSVVPAGASFGYTGTDNSMRLNALYTWGPKDNPGPAGFLFLRNPVLGKDSLGMAYLAMASNPFDLRGQSIWEIKVDPLTGLLKDEPQPVVNYVGDTKATVVGLAEGPDGMYFTDFFGDSRGVGNDAKNGRIWKLVASEKTLDLVPIDELAGAPSVERGRTFFETNCRVCHSKQNRGSRVGPALDGIGQILQERLHGHEYEATVQKLLQSDASYFVSQRPQLQAILDAEGKSRVRLWLQYHIADPRFDNPYSKMPQFMHTLTPEKRENIIDYLLDANE